MMFRSIILASALVFTTVQAQAAVITYDFESEATTSLGGDLTVLAMLSGGVTMTLTREAGDVFDIVNISGAAPASWGSRSLYPFASLVGNAFIADFTSLLSSVTIDAGDFTPSDTDALLIEAYAGPGATGLLLDTFLSAPCCDVGSSFVGISGGVAAAGIASIRFIGGSAPFPNSLFYDNIVVNTEAAAPVPEPASLLLIGTGLAAGARRWRNRRSNV